MDAATKKKVATKRTELRTTRGELAELQEARETDNLTDEQINILDRRIDFARNKSEMLQLDLRELGDIVEEINQITKKLTQKEENELIETLIKKNHIGYLIEDNKFIYCLQMAVENNNGVVNPQFRTVETSKIVNVLNKMANTKLQSDTYSVQTLFQQSKNDYYGMTGSFNDEKWDNTMVYNKMSVIREFWVKETVWFFDALTLGNGKSNLL